MPRKITPAPGTPSTGMRVDVESPQAAFLPVTPNVGTDLSATLHQRINVTPYTVGATPKRLTAAGIVAMVTAINTYLAALSAANRDALLNTVDPSIVVRPDLVSFPILGTDAASVTSILATVVNTGANVVAF